MATNPSAAERNFAMPELAEHILWLMQEYDDYYDTFEEYPLVHLFAVQRVSKASKAITESSGKLQRAMLLAYDTPAVGSDIGENHPTRIDAVRFLLESRMEFFFPGH